MELAGLIPAFGSLFVTASAFVVALSVIVAIHEFGHYIVGRWSGIHAEVFSLGFGPRLWSRVDKRGTRWQIAALPLGGYVKFLGDANAASAGEDTKIMATLSPEERRHTMHGAPLWARAVTVAAGPLFNFILSIVVFSVFFIVSGAASDKLTIGSLNPLPGGSGGLLAGDEILAVDGKPTPDWEALNAVADGLPASAVLTYHVRRDGMIWMCRDRSRCRRAPARFCPARRRWKAGCARATSSPGLMAGPWCASATCSHWSPPETARRWFWTSGAMERTCR